MLDNSVVKKIEDFVFMKPRSVQEIALHVGRNWRTADRYIDEIGKEFGTIATKVFREGTRGALKIVYWASIEKVSHSVFQENLEKELQTKNKEDFSAFDIFQHVSDNNKKARIENPIDENATDLSDLEDFLKNAKKQVLFFSGNFSFVNLKNKNFDMMKIIEGMVKKNISIKALGRVDIAGRKNVEKLLSLNFKHGKELIEIRHREQPLRAIIIDNKIFRMKEVKEPTGRLKELDKKIFIFYTIKDKEWTEWLSRIFWKNFSNSISSQKRFEEINKLKIAV